MKPVSLLLFIVAVVLPYVALALAFDWGIRKALRSPSPARSVFLYPLLSAFLITAGFAVWGFYGISTSRSSTAAIGYVFLSINCTAVALIALVVSWSIFYLLRFGLERFGRLSTRLTNLPLCVIALAILAVSASVARSKLARHRLVAAARTGPSTPAAIDRAIADLDWRILTKAAFNPNTSEADLRKLFVLCQEQPPSRYPPENDVLSSLSRNPKTPPDILAGFANSPSDPIRIQVATNPGTPTEVLPLLAADPAPLVRTWVTTHPKIPEELLLKLARDSDEIVQDYAKTNLQRREFMNEPNGRH